MTTGLKKTKYPEKLFKQASLINVQLVLSLSDEFARYDYYTVTDKKGNELFALKEYQSFNNEEMDLQLFPAWQSLIDNLKMYEHISQTNNKETWWSYCDDWLLLNPLFISEHIKPLLGNEITAMLKDIHINDLRPFEKERFQIWINACQ
jgi:hypothetical protein